MDYDNEIQKRAEHQFNRYFENHTTTFDLV